MRENNNDNLVEDSNRAVALGICFGSGIGIILGMFIDNILFGISGGAVIGVLVGIIIDNKERFSKLFSKNKILKGEENGSFNK